MLTTDEIRVIEARMLAARRGATVPEGPTTSTKPGVSAWRSGYAAAVRDFMEIAEDVRKGR